MANKPIHGSPDQRSYYKFTLSTGAGALSDVLDAAGLVPIALETSTTWTAAGIGFRAAYKSTAALSEVFRSSDGSRLRVSSAAIPTSTAGYITLEPDRFDGFRYFQLFSNTTAGVATAQNSTRYLYVTLGVPHGPVK